MAKMAASEPIYVLLFGKAPGHIKAVSEIVKPEYEVLQTFTTIDSALPVLPTLLPKIRLAMMGGGFPPSDFQKILDQVPGAKDIPWMRPDVSGGVAPQMPSAESIAGRVRKCLDEKRGEIERGSGGGEVWGF